MNKKNFIIVIILLSGCMQKSSQIEKEYIKNLEEKNAILEKELKVLRSQKDKPEKKQTQEYSIKKEDVKKPLNSQDYFTIGSTEEEVIAIMGVPSSYSTAGSTKVIWYGSSPVYFTEGKVDGYSNLGKNLKVNVGK